MQHIAGTQRAPGVTAKLPEGKGAFAAKIIRHINATAQAKIAAHPGTAHLPQTQGAARGDRKHGMHRKRCTVERDPDTRPGNYRHGVGIKFQRRTAERDFQRSIGCRISQ